MTTDIIPCIRGRSIDDVAPLDRTAADLALLMATGAPADVKGKSLSMLRAEHAMHGPSQEDIDADQYCLELTTRLRGFGWSRAHVDIWVNVIRDAAYSIADDMDNATGAGSPFDPSVAP